MITTMTKFPIQTYLKEDNKSLHFVLLKLKKLQQWNQWLQTALPSETQLLQHCQITNLDGNALIVIVENAHWATRLRFYIPFLVEHFKKYPDFKNLSAICCKIRPAHLIRTSYKRRRKMNISLESAKVLLKAAEKITDVKLKLILEKIAKKGN